jgi:glycosyltransferase involved in cell wall biosynthesis
MLVIVGQFSPEHIEYNFDFYRGELYNYLGIINDPQVMASIYRGCNRFLMTYYNDACSNSLIESLLCGCAPDIRGLGNTGGTPEITRKYIEFGDDYFTLARMTKEYITLFEGL